MRLNQEEKMMKKYLVALTGLMVGCFLTSTAVAKDIAVVDMEKVFEGYTKTTVEREALDKEQKEKEDQGRAMMEEINKLRDEILLLSDEAKAEKEEVIREKIRELQEFGQNSKQELLQKRDMVWKTLVDEIKAVISKEAKDKKYSMVITKNVLLYNEDAIEITDTILEKVNKNYKK